MKRQVAAMFAEDSPRTAVAVPIPLMQPLLILALELVAALQIELPTDSRPCPAIGILGRSPIG
jgi:hypothetical protein